MNELQEEIKKVIIEKSKAEWFIEHIKNHLKEDEQVICKICNKSVDEIAEDSFQKILDIIESKKTEDGKN